MQVIHYACRFVHELNKLQRESEASCCRLSRALSCLEEAMKKAGCLQDKIKREGVVLGEKSEACTKLLVQIGQDTAISCQHSKLVAKQKERITHLKKVLDSVALCFLLRGHLSEAQQNKTHSVCGAQGL